MRTWRARGDALFALIIVGLFLLEVVVLGMLTIAVALRPSGLVSARLVEELVIAAIAATALAVMGITMFVLGYHVLTARRERLDDEAAQAWGKRWTEVLFGGRAAPAGPLPPEAIEALLCLRESLRGVESGTVVHLLRRYRIAEHALERCLPQEGHGARAWARWLLDGPNRRHGLSRRLGALETLARARVPETFDGILPFVRDDEAAVRRMALRALARTLGAMSDGAKRTHAAARFAEVLGSSGAPQGVLEDALVLADEVAPEVIRAVLATPRLGAGLVRASIEAAGKRGLIELAEPLAERLDDESAEVRAAVLRALRRIGYLPGDAGDLVLAALADDVEFVRTQAVRAAVLLGADAVVPRYTDLLADRSWWVRRAAAQGLLEVGKRGQAALEWAARTHPDRYGREMAVQILLDAGRLGPDEARRLRETA